MSISDAFQLSIDTGVLVRPVGSKTYGYKISELDEPFMSCPTYSYEIVTYWNSLYDPIQEYRRQGERDIQILTILACPYWEIVSPERLEFESEIANEKYKKTEEQRLNKSREAQSV